MYEIAKPDNIVVYASSLSPPPRHKAFDLRKLTPALKSVQSSATNVMTSASMYFLWKRGSRLLWLTVHFKKEYIHRNQFIL